MRILLALDKFKGTLTALEACARVREGLTASGFADAEFTTCPIADGGEGTVEALAARLPGKLCEVEVENAVGSRSVTARYWMDRSAPDGVTAYMEMASASGLALLEAAELDPERATTFGTGQLMRAALADGAKRLVIGLGGSATNDGGSGLARALGYQFLDGEGAELVWPMDLVRLAEIRPPAQAPSFECLVLADVTNPLLGPDGATAVYGPQKGVTAKSFEHLEAALTRLADVAARDLGLDCRGVAGAGAAGGCAFGLVSFVGARIVPGFDYVSECTGLEEAIGEADLVITGEGRMDSQTLSGKGPHGVARLAGKHGKPVAALCGSVEEKARPVLIETFGCLRALTDDVSPSEAMERPGESLVQSSRRLGEMLR